MNKEFEKRNKAALQVLSELVKIDGQIVFLGGTAIQVLLPKPKRLSIDLDISYSHDPKKLVTFLEGLGYTITKRQSRNPTFIFYTISKDGILTKLDITKFPIHETEKHKVQDFEVLLPKQCYFLAAKLSSLAFGTIGRFEPEQLQIVKDIFDIDCLLDNNPNLKNMGIDWLRVIADQNKLRGTNFKETQCAESIQKTLLKCVDIDPTPSFFISQNTLGSFLDSLISGKINRQDLSVITARALLLLVTMNDNFYEIEKKVLSEYGDLKKLDEAEQILVSKKILPAKQICAIKITAPKALMYLRYWVDRKRGENPVTSDTDGV